MSDVLNPSRNTKNLDFLASLTSNPKPVIAAPAKPAPKFDSASYDNQDGPPRQFLEEGETEF